MSSSTENGRSSGSMTDVHGDGQPVAYFEIELPAGQKIQVRERKPGDFPQDGPGHVNAGVRAKIAADFEGKFQHESYLWLNG